MRHGYRADGVSNGDKKIPKKRQRWKQMIRINRIKEQKVNYANENTFGSSK